MYSLYIIQLLLRSYEQEIWFYLNKNLLQKRLTGGWGSITKQNTGNLLLLLIYAEYHNSPFILLKNKMSPIMARFYLRFSYLLFWIILPSVKGNHKIFEKSLVTVSYCKSCYLFVGYGLMSLKISITSHWNASPYNSVHRGQNICHNQPKNRILMISYSQL